jgi:malate synthase
MNWANRVSFPIPEPSFQQVLTPEAVAFVAQLDSEFAARRVEILEQRRETKARLAAGHGLEFLPHTAAIRDDPTWRVAEPATDLLDRRVEITGPTDRKMAINALNSKARVWLADFEDATSPTWRNVVSGQLNLMDALAGRIEFTNPEGKRYEVRD